MTTYQTIGSYAVLIGAAGIYYLATRQKNDKGPRTKATAKQVKEIVKQKPTKAKKVRREGGHSSGDQGNTERESPKTGAQATPAHVTQDVLDESDEVDNKEFARQLSSAKSGTLLPSKSAEGSKQKSVKQSKAQEKATTFETSSDATAPSSAAGGDADDDRSSANSPEFGASTSDGPVTDGGIDDMLEASAPGPSVLKITAPANPSQPKKAKTQATAETAESKKQRQNRKKAEEKKAIREEEEKQRKIALEKQRRTAREAEGRAAKDGSTFTASQAPSSSVWTAPKETLSEGETASKAKIDLLDTYEPTSSKAAASSQSESELVGGGDWQKIASTLPEEEQMRRALEESDNWETVKEKKNKKKTKTTQSPPQERIEPELPKEQPKPKQGTATGAKTTASTGKENIKRVQVEREVELQDSEWDVAGYGDN